MEYFYYLLGTKKYNMKKTILSLLFGVLSIGLNAQFFEKVNYIGALPSNPSGDWTKGWVNWTPKSTPYGDVTDSVTLKSSTGEVDITATLTLDPSKVYLLQSMVVVKEGGKLIIPAGTVIRGLANPQSTPKQYATIVVERGGLIQVEGTKTNPVVMTSAKKIGQRDRGDWGGLLLAGKASNNQGIGIQMEGFNNVAFNNQLAKHGGIVDNDNSGSVSYLRIEFGGYAFEPNKEINGFTFCSVGSTTTIDNVQVSYSGDDSYEWFGGSVNCKHLIAFKGTDDDFDTDFGYHGAVQFGIGFRDSSYFDLSWNVAGGSTSECFESDNDAAGSGKLPFTTAVYSNMTCVGPVPAGMKWTDLSSTARGAFRRGARIRRNSRENIVNSIFMGYRNFLMFDGDSVIINSGVRSGTFSDKYDVFRNNYLYGVKAAAPAGATNTGLCEVSSNGKISTLDSWVRNSYNLDYIDTTPFQPGFLVNTNDFNSPDFRPTKEYPANYEFGVMGYYGVANVKTVGKVKATKAYPNPTSGDYTVEFLSPNPFTASIYITDVNGRVVNSQANQNITTGTNFVNVNLSTLSNGLYYFHIEGSDNHIVYQVFIAK